MKYNKIMLFMLSIIAFHSNKTSPMLVKQNHLVDNKEKSSLPVPSFHIVHSNPQLTNQVKCGIYFAFPRPAHHFIDPELYAQAFQQVSCINLGIAQKIGINEEAREFYRRRLIAEQYCIKYDMKARQYNHQYPLGQKSPLIPDFHKVHCDNDMAMDFFYDENKKYYSYPEPANSLICIPFYRRTVIKTLKVNLIMAHEQGLDNDNIIKPYILRILSQLEWDSYNLAIMQNTQV